MRLTVKALAATVEEQGKRVAALESELGEMSRFVPGYLESKRGKLR